MTKHRTKKPESTSAPNDAHRAEDAPTVTGEVLIKMMQNPCVRDLEFEHPRTPGRTRRVKI
jgi:hypothetical protein